MSDKSGMRTVVIWPNLKVKPKMAEIEELRKKL